MSVLFFRPNPWVLFTLGSFAVFSRLASINQNQTHLDFCPGPVPLHNDSFKNANKFQNAGVPSTRWHKRGRCVAGKPLNLSHLKYDDKQKQTAAERKSNCIFICRNALCTSPGCHAFASSERKKYKQLLKSLCVHPPMLFLFFFLICFYFRPSGKQENQLRNYDSLVMLGEKGKLNSHTENKRNKSTKS